MVSGSWNEPNSDRIITDATKLDIDHMVPLKEGPPVWCCQLVKRAQRAYANDLDDPETLIAVDLGLNRQKGAKDPAEWLSPNPAYQTEYVNAWVAVTLKYGCQSWQKNAEAPSTLSMPSYQSLK